MKRFSVKIRLGLAFSVLIALLSTVGGLALNRMAHVNENMAHLISHHWAKVQLSREALSYSSANNRITLQVFLMAQKDEIDALLVQRAQNTEKISGLVRKIEEDLETERERDLLTAIKEARTPYIESYKRALKLQLQDKQQDEARISMVQVTLPLLTRYHAAWNAFVQYQGDEMDRWARRAQANYAATRNEMFTLIVLAVISAIVIMVFATRRIAREVAERQRAEDALREAHDELEGRVEQRTVQLAAANGAMHVEIAERQRAEEARLKAQRERDVVEVRLHQAQKLEAVGRLAAGIAHEINTPVQYVGDNTRFLDESFQSLRHVLGPHEELLHAAKQSGLTPELVARAEEVTRASDLGYLYEQIPAAIRETLEGVGRIAKIVQAMKEFSHPGGKEKAATDLNRAIETTVTVARSEWKYVADVKLELDPTLPLVPCFAGEFNQSILNLIINAAHAIGDAVRGHPGAKGEITIRTRRDGDCADIRVIDTGTGIPEAARRRIFEPFFRTKEVGKGTGQGLSIVYGCIVKNHGGTVTFETETGKGTTFILRLPLHPAQAPTEERKAQPTDKPAATESAVTLATKTIP